MICLRSHSHGRAERFLIFINSQLDLLYPLCLPSEPIPFSKFAGRRIEQPHETGSPSLNLIPWGSLSGSFTSLAEKLELSIKASDPRYSSSRGWGVLGSRWPSSYRDQAGTVCGTPPQQGWCRGCVGGTLRRLGAPGETFIFPELYHFFHNTILPSRWKVPAGG